MPVPGLQPFILESYRANANAKVVRKRTMVRN